MDWTSYNQGQVDAGLSKSLSKLSQTNTLTEALRREQYVANSLENVAANKDRMIKSWDNIVWEIVKRIKDFDPETRYRILGVCKGQDATPEDTMRELRKVQDAWYAKIKAESPKDNSDTNVPALRNKYENAAI
ncbi:MAG: hypothetical protein ACYDB0_00935 [Acidithiobacillus sp.]